MSDRMVNFNLKKTYSKENIRKAFQSRFGHIELNKILEELDKEIENSDVKFLTHEEVFSNLKGELLGE